ncbi:hypothetical protein VNO77_16368 [Canavalia gladiata]|uniref:Uncharacterized protein n=1 Tax=Canavalia gladiata TaxID=3824 RepID=A0AAN9M5Q5_CANGL
MYHPSTDYQLLDMGIYKVTIILSIIIMKGQTQQYGACIPICPFSVCKIVLRTQRWALQAYSSHLYPTKTNDQLKKTASVQKKLAFTVQTKRRIFHQLK